MPLFPMFLRLQGRKCVVVGAGQIAASKAAGLIAAGARTVVIAPRATTAVQNQAKQGKLTWVRRQFLRTDLRGAFLAVAATDSSAVNQAVFRACAERGVLCNVVDDPEHCDFFYPAVVRRGALQIAISTDAHSPALARRLRKELEQQFGPEYAPWVEHVAALRQEILNRRMTESGRKKLLEQIVSREAFEEFVQKKSSPQRTRRN